MATGYDILLKLPDDIKVRGFDLIVNRIEQSGKHGSSFVGYDVVNVLNTLVHLYREQIK